MTGTLGLCSGSPRTEREPTTASRAPKRLGGAKDVFSRRNSPLLSPRPSIDAPTLSSIDAIMSLGKVEKVGRRDVVHSEQPFKGPERKCPALRLDRDDPGASPAQEGEARAHGFFS